jgi:hypothetical protein
VAREAIRLTAERALRALRWLAGTLAPLIHRGFQVGSRALALCLSGVIES